MAKRVSLDVVRNVIRADNTAKRPKARKDGPGRVPSYLVRRLSTYFFQIRPPASLAPCGASCPPIRVRLGVLPRPLRERIPRTLRVQCPSFLRTRLCQCSSLHYRSLKSEVVAMAVHTTLIGHSSDRASRRNDRGQIRKTLFRRIIHGEGDFPHFGTPLLSARHITAYGRQARD